MIHFEQWERDDIEVKLLLKGGGCENMNAQYSLPAELAHLGRADRTIDGVRKAILHAVWNAQGKALRPARSCASAAIARAATSKRSSSCSAASTTSMLDPRLADLEAEIMRTANTLGVGRWASAGRSR